MTTTAIKPVEPALAIENVLIEGDLSRLSADQKVAYYMKVCESLGLNPYTKPFDYLKLNGREILYARKDCTDQLRKAQHISILHLRRERVDDLYVVTATASTPDGRTDSAIGAVMIKGLGGEGLANALMKAETKAKRRVTLSICGLGMTDDSEVDSIPGAQRSHFVDDDGVVIEPMGDSQPFTPTRLRDVDDRPRSSAPPTEQPAREPEHQAGSRDPAIEAALEKWIEACAWAAKHDIPHKQLAANAPLKQIEGWTIALNERIEAHEMTARVAADADADMEAF